MGTHNISEWKFAVSFRVINNISIRGAATVYIIYQIIDINVNIYDIVLYHKWLFKEKEKNQKKKNIYKVNKYYKCIRYYIYNIYILNIYY